jgi:hypothetical protein
MLLHAVARRESTLKYCRWACWRESWCSHPSGERTPRGCPAWQQESLPCCRKSSSYKAVFQNPAPEEPKIGKLNRFHWKFNSLTAFIPYLDKLPTLELGVFTLMSMLFKGEITERLSRLKDRTFFNSVKQRRHWCLSGRAGGNTLSSQTPAAADHPYLWSRAKKTLMCEWAGLAGIPSLSFSASYSSWPFIPVV